MSSAVWKVARALLLAIAGTFATIVVGFVAVGTAGDFGRALGRVLLFSFCSCIVFIGLFVYGILSFNDQPDRSSDPPSTIWKIAKSLFVALVGACVAFVVEVIVVIAAGGLGQSVAAVTFSLVIPFVVFAGLLIYGILRFKG